MSNEIKAKDLFTGMLIQREGSFVTVKSWDADDLSFTCTEHRDMEFRLCDFRAIPITGEILDRIDNQWPLNQYFYLTWEIGRWSVWVQSEKLQRAGFSVRYLHELQRLCLVVGPSLMLKPK